MRRIILATFLLLALLPLHAQTWIRVNQAGYLPDDSKVAVLISTGETDGSFCVYDAMSDALVLKAQGKAADPSKWALKSAWRLDMSALQAPGSYYIVSGGVKSPVFRIKELFSIGFTYTFGQAKK